MEWLDANGVSRAIDHPIGESRPKNEEERKNLLANFRKHECRFDRFCIIQPDEVKMDIYSGNAKRLFGW